MIAELKAMLGMDASKFNAETKKAGNNVDKFSAGLGKIKGLIAGAFAGVAIRQIAKFTRAALDLGSAIVHLATQSGLTTDEFQALEVSALASGVATEKIRAVMAKLTVVLGQAQNGVTTYMELFNRAGISMGRLILMTKTEAFEELSRQFVTAGNDADKLGAIFELLGTRAGPQFTAMMREMADVGMQGMIDKARGMNQIMDEETAVMLERVATNMDLFWRRMKVGWSEFLDDTRKVFVPTQEEKEFDKRVAERAREMAERAGIKKPFFELGALLRRGEARVQLEAEDKLRKEKEKTAKKAAEATERGVRAREKLLTGLYEKELKLIDKRIEKEMAADEKRADKAVERQTKIFTDYAKKQADLLAGKGIAAPRPAPVGRLQAIGGIVGGVAGAGQQEARVQERQAAIQEAIKELTEETNRKLDDVAREIGLLGEEY